MLHQYKKMLLLHDAVYYREQRFEAESAVVVIGQVFSIGNLAQCLNISQSGTLSDIRNSGTVSDQELRNTVRSGTQEQYSITIHHPYFFNVHCQYQPLPIPKMIINCLSNKYNSAAANVSRCQSRLNVVTRMPCNLSSFFKSKFDLISRKFFHNLNGVPLGTPTQLQSLLQSF